MREIGINFVILHINTYKVEGDRVGGGDGGLGGSRKLEVMGAGSVQEAGEERAGNGIPKGVGAGGNRE